VIPITAFPKWEAEHRQVRVIPVTGRHAHSLARPASDGCSLLNLAHYTDPAESFILESCLTLTQARRTPNPESASG